MRTTLSDRQGHTTGDALQAAILLFMSATNEAPKPFLRRGRVWDRPSARNG